MVAHNDQLVLTDTQSHHVSVPRKKGMRAERHVRKLKPPVIPCVQGGPKRALQEPRTRRQIDGEAAPGHKVDIPGAEIAMGELVCDPVQIEVPGIFLPVKVLREPARIHAGNIKTPRKELLKHECNGTVLPGKRKQHAIALFRAGQWEKPAGRPERSRQVAFIPRLRRHGKSKNRRVAAFRAERPNARLARQGFHRLKTPFGVRPDDQKPHAGKHGAPVRRDRREQHRHLRFTVDQGAGTHAQDECDSRDRLHAREDGPCFHGA